MYMLCLFFFVFYSHSSFTIHHSSFVMHQHLGWYDELHDDTRWTPWMTVENKNKHFRSHFGSSDRHFLGEFPVGHCSAYFRWQYRRLAEAPDVKKFRSEAPDVNKFKTLIKLLLWVQGCTHMSHFKPHCAPPKASGNSRRQISEIWPWNPPGPAEPPRLEKPAAFP